MSGKRKIDVPKQRVAANPEKVLKLTRPWQQPERRNVDAAGGPVHLCDRRVRLG